MANDTLNFGEQSKLTSIKMDVNVPDETLFEISVNASKEDYKMLEKETNKFIRGNTLANMLELIVEWGEDNEIPFVELEDEFENLYDWEGHDFPEIYL